MEWWQTLLMGGASCFITLLVTFLFNYITNRPKKQREKREKELSELRSEFKQAVQEVRDEAAKQSDDCKNDHQCLAKIVGEVQKTNVAQNAGLVSILRVELEKGYTKWLELGYAPLSERDDLEHMFNAYSTLGGNSVVVALREKFLKLPLKDKEK